MYKFYTIPNEEVLRKIIGPSPSIKFASAFNLNDPNELKFNLLLDPESPEMKARYFIDNPGSTEEQYESWKNQVSPNFIWYTKQQQRGAIGMSITLTCFTSSFDNNLMWSHYTYNHQGICVEYQPELFQHLEQLPGYFGQNYVTYQDDPPIVNGARLRTEETIQQMIFTKQSEWSYEKEARVVLLSDQDVDFITFPQGMIKRVIIGSRAPQSLVNQVMSCLSGSAIDVYYAVNTGESYKVTLAQHKENTFYTRTFWG